MGRKSCAGKVFSAKDVGFSDIPVPLSEPCSVFGQDSNFAFNLHREDVFAESNQLLLLCSTLGPLKSADRDVVFFRYMVLDVCVCV